MPNHSTRRQFVQRTAALIGAAAVGLEAKVTAAGQAGAGFGGKFAICNETFGDWPFEKAFDFAAQCGYEGVEFAPFTISNYVTDVSANRRREIRRQVDKAGLKTVGLHWLLAKTDGFHLTSPDPDVRRKTAYYLGELARFGADLGGDLLVFGSPQQRNLLPGVTREQAVQHAAEVVRLALPIFDKTNVRLAFEPLSPSTTSFLQTAQETAELVKLIDAPRVRMILDCNAMASERDPIPDLVRRHRDLLVHFHANDPNRQGPGFGELDFVPIFKALREIDFRAWVSVEVFDYSPGPERLARESIDYMKRCLAKSA
jgi:sugar phosphate isomerase/epimerase